MWQIHLYEYLYSSIQTLISDSMYIKMKILNFKDFMKNYNLKNDTMNAFDLQRVNNYPIYPRDSKIFSDKDS